MDTLYLAKFVNTTSFVFFSTSGSKINPPSMTTATMKAAVVMAQGKEFSQNLEVIEKEVPPPKKGEIMIKVARAATNTADLKIVDGTLGFVFRPKPRFTLGHDFSGVISSIPEGVDAQGFAVGDRVCGFNVLAFQGECGTFAEYTCAMPQHLFKVPTGVSFEEAAALPMASSLIYPGLKDKLKIATGQKLLLFGGSTAIGLLGLAMARDFGCTDVVCTSTSEALCKSFGATKVVNYRTDDVVASLKSFEKSFDCAVDLAAGYKGWQQSPKLLKDGGKFLAAAFDDGRDAQMGIGLIARMLGANINRGFWSLCGYPTYIQYMQSGQVCAPYVQYFLDLQASGKMPSILDASQTPFAFTTAGFQAMMQKQQSGTCKGKLIMNICPEIQ